MSTTPKIKNPGTACYWYCQMISEMVWHNPVSPSHIGTRCPQDLKTCSGTSTCLKVLIFQLRAVVATCWDHSGPPMVSRGEGFNLPKMSSSSKGEMMSCAMSMSRPSTLCSTTVKLNCNNEYNVIKAGALGVLWLIHTCHSGLRFPQ